MFEIKQTMESKLSWELLPCSALPSLVTATTVWRIDCFHRTMSRFEQSEGIESRDFHYHYKQEVPAYSYDIGLLVLI